MTSAILLIGHGTRNPIGQQQFLRLAERLRAAVAPRRLELAYIEIQSPLIDEALLRMHADGFEEITLSPALLFAAGHAKQDIPAAVAKAVVQAPDLKVSVAEPLGCHSSIIELAAASFSYSLAPVLRGEGRGEGLAPAQDSAVVMVRTADPTKTALVLIGRGSSDPAAIAHCREFAAQVAARVQIPKVFTGFIAIAAPSLPEVVEQAAASGAEQIVVQPHLLFSGEMLNTTAAAVATARQKHPRIDWRLSDSLGADLLESDGISADCLVRALQDRIRALGPN